MLNDNLGEHIRRKREEKGITLRAFAKKTNLSATFISRFETGGIPSPGEEKIRNMSIVLGEDIDKLLLLSHKIPFDLQEKIKALSVSKLKKLRDYVNCLENDKDYGK